MLPTDNYLDYTIKLKETTMSVPNMIQDVTDFHRTFGHPVLDRPTIPPPARQVLRSALLRDEYLQEFDPAWVACAKAYKDSILSLGAGCKGSDPIGSGEPFIPCLTEMADVIADLIYYLIGTALEYGIPLEQVWNAVQESNMAKLWSCNQVAALPGPEDPRELHHIEFIASPYKGWTATATNESRMQWTVRDETGKVRKPPGWKEPDVKGIIARAMQAGPDPITASNAELAR